MHAERDIVSENPPVSPSHCINKSTYCQTLSAVFNHASLCVSAVPAVIICVHLSVPLVCCVETAKDTIKLISLPSSSILFLSQSAVT